MKRSALRKRIIQKLLAHPGTLFLFIAGLTDLAVLWTFDIQSGLGIFAGLFGIMGACGLLLTRFLFKNKDITGEAFESLKQEAREAYQSRLDTLDRNLVADGDPNTEKLLRDLRTLTEIFQDGSLTTDNFDRVSSMDILDGVQQLFERCVLSLEKSLTLWHAAQSIETKEARTPILEQRETIISEVQQSVTELSKLLADVNNYKTTTDTENLDLKHIRNELSNSIQRAKEVDQHLREMETGPLSTRLASSRTEAKQ